MIPLPFVSRARLRAAEEDARQWKQAAQRATEIAERLAADVQRYDRLYADYSRLVQQVVSLKRRGFEPQPERQKPRAMLPEPEEVGLRRAEEQVMKAVEEEFITKAAADIVAKGFDAVAAAREARRLLAEATDAHPAGG